MKRRLILLTAALVLLAACNGPAGESVPTQTPFSPVYTDWSKLEPYRPDRGLYTRYYDRPVDRLLAVEGGYGGPLIGFIGSLQRSGSGWSNVVKYGLATADGTVVCDPIYSSVHTENGCLILNRTDLVSEGGWETQDRVTVAAADGSWVLPGEYRRVWSMSDGRLLLADTAGDLWFCGRNGALAPSPLTETLHTYLEIALAQTIHWIHFQDGLAIYHSVSGERAETGGWLLNAVTGEVRSLPRAINCWGWTSDDPLTVASVGELYGYLDRSGGWAIPPQFRWAGEFEGDCAEVELEEGGTALIDRSGRVVVRVHGHLYTAADRGGNIYYLDYTWDEDAETVEAVYDGKGRLLPDHPLTGREAALNYCAATTAEDLVIAEENRNMTVKGDIMTLWDYDGAVLGMVEGAQDLSLQSCENGRAVLYRWTAWDAACGVYDLEAGAWIVPLGDYSSIQIRTDGTDTVYTAWMKNADGYDILREDGTLVARADTFYGFTRGVLQCVRGDASVWLDLNGEEAFRWPIQDNSD